MGLIKHIHAIFTPQPGKQLSSKAEAAKGKRFRFRETEPRNGKRMFYADDKNFVDPIQCTEDDLMEIEDEYNV